MHKEGATVTDRAASACMPCCQAREILFETDDRALSASEDTRCRFVASLVSEGTKHRSIN